MCLDEVLPLDSNVYHGHIINTTSWAVTQHRQQCASPMPSFFWDRGSASGWYSDSVALPAAGMYTAATCAKFPLPDPFAIRECALVQTDTCAGNTACPIDTECVAIPGGHDCRCEQGQLKVGFENMACSSDGVKLSVVFQDQDHWPDSHKVVALAGDILQSMRADQVLQPAVNTSLARVAYNVLAASALVREWSLSVYLPLQWLMSPLTGIQTLLEASCAVHNYTFVRFAQDDVSQAIDGVQSSGLVIMDKYWIDSPDLGVGWQLQLKVPASQSTRKVLYVSKTDADGALMGLSDTQRPCRFTGESSGDAGCCIQQISAMFHLPLGLSGFANCTRDELDLPLLSLHGVMGAGRNQSVATTQTLPDGSVQVDLFVSYHDAETGFAQKTVQQGAIQFEWFVGVADVSFFGPHMSVAYTQQSLKAVIASTYTVMSELAVTDTLSQHVDVQILRVQDPLGHFEDFARVSLTITDADMRFTGQGIPHDSATFRIGYTQTQGGAAYMCTLASSSAFAAFQSEHTCAFQEPVCTSIMLVETHQHLVYVFPLGRDTLQPVLSAYDQSPSAMIQKLYLDFFVEVRNTASNKVSHERVQTSSQILRHAMQVQCSTVSSSIKLEDLVRIDMINGLVQNASELTSSVSYFHGVTTPNSNEICDDINPDSVCMKTPQFGMGSMTYLVLGEHGMFAASSQSAYELRVSAMFSIYFLSELKRIKVRNLLRQNKAFVVPNGKTLSESTELLPTEELLTLCPLSVVRNNYGCISRWEVEDGVFDFQTQSITALHTPRDMNTSGAIVNQTDVNLRNWIHAGALGESAFISRVAQEHSDVVTGVFELNDRYRKAFVQSNELPWTASALRALNITTRIDLVQDTFTFMLVTMHSTLHEHKEAVYAKVRHSASIGLSCEFFTAHPYLTNTYVDVYALVFGLNRELVSISDATSAPDGSTRCQFFVDMELPYQQQLRALAQGAKLVSYLGRADSVLSQRIASTLRDAFYQLQRRLGIDLALADGDDFRGPAEAQLVPYHSAQNRRRLLERPARVLHSVPGTIDNMTRNESLFASELTSRRYKDVNSADIMALLVEDELKAQGRGDEIQNGTSRLAIIEILVPLEIACLPNETMALLKMREVMEEALKKSTSTSVASIMPTSFVVLDDLQCQSLSRRRLLQSGGYITARSEMVFTPAKSENRAVVVTPERILRTLPEGVQMVSITQAATLNPSAISVKSSWIGAMPPDAVGLPLYYSETTTDLGPKHLLRALQLSTVSVLVLSLVNLLVTVYYVYSLKTPKPVYGPLAPAPQYTDGARERMPMYPPYAPMPMPDYPPYAPMPLPDYRGHPRYQYPYQG